MHTTRAACGRFLALALAPLILAAGTADAQRPDFLFHEPRGTMSFQLGWSMPREGSDLFDDLREDFTIQQGDFGSLTFGADIAFTVLRQLDVVLGLDHARAERVSEERGWLEDGWPILQTSELGTTNFTASARIYPLSRGRAYGSHAWVPAPIAPFVGGGAGLTWYTFDLHGDFVDRTTVDDPEGALIITRHWRSSGVTPAAHVLGGLEFSLTPRIVLRGEYRYHWASASLDSRDFYGYEPIDLAGHRAVLGIATRF